MNTNTMDERIAKQTAKRDAGVSRIAFETSIEALVRSGTRPRRSSAASAALAGSRPRAGAPAPRPSEARTAQRPEGAVVCGAHDVLRYGRAGSRPARPFQQPTRIREGTTWARR